MAPDLARIAAELFRTMMGLEVRATGSDWTPSGAYVAGEVRLSGAWNGAVVIECTPAQAREFAGRLMSVPIPADVNDEVRDTIGEIADIIGGNLKAVLPHGVAQSAPSVTECAAGRLHSRQSSRLIEHLVFSGAGEDFCIALIEAPVSERGADERFPAEAAQTS